jgi:hypothetical protein
MAGLGSLFAPAYQAGNQQSIDAVDQWMATNFGMTNPKVEATRRPAGFNTGNPAGMVDPEALRVLAQGGPYDPTTRDQIAAAQLAAQPQAAAAPAAGAGQPPLQFPTGGYYGTPEGQYFMWEQQQLAQNGPPRIAPPTYTDSYGGGSGTGGEGG